MNSTLVPGSDTGTRQREGESDNRGSLSHGGAVYAHLLRGRFPAFFAVRFLAAFFFAVFFFAFFTRSGRTLPPVSRFHSS